MTAATQVRQRCLDGIEPGIQVPFPGTSTAPVNGLGTHHAKGFGPLI
jgi:hypothetical protein